MEIVWNICLEATEILTLTVGILGLFFSLLLIISPEAFRAVSRKLNNYIDIDQKISFLDKEVQTRRMIYRKNVISGIALIAGSVIIIIFLLYLDIQNFINVFFTTQKYLSIIDIFFSALVWIIALTAGLGILIGTGLIFRPSLIQKLENKMNTRFSTEPVIKKLDETHPNIDSFVYNSPKLFGVIGLLASIILTILAAGNLIE